jgi:hypothetical protein
MWLQLLLTLLIALFNWLINRGDAPSSKQTKLGQIRDMCGRVGDRLAGMGVAEVAVTNAELKKVGIKEF